MMNMSFNMIQHLYFKCDISDLFFISRLELRCVNKELTNNYNKLYIFILEYDFISESQEKVKEDGVENVFPRKKQTIKFYDGRL